MSTGAVRILAVMVILSLATAVAPCAAAVTDGATGTATSATPDDDLAWLKSVLEAKGVDEAMRAGAARRLLRSNDPAALQVLARGLRSNELPVTEAVLIALVTSDREGPIPDMLTSAAIDAMSRLSPERREQVVTVAARATDPVNRLAAIAFDTNLQPSLRVHAINELYAIRSSESIAALIGLLDPARGEGPEVLEAVCRGLKLLTGTDYGQDVSAWRQWWQQVQGQPLEELLQARIRSLESQLTERKRTIDELQRELDRRAARLTQAYQELFVTLLPEQRQERMVALLADDIIPVRAFALDAIDRMIRNGEVPSNAIQAALVDRLTDRDATLRATALRLLDDLGSTQLEDAFATTFLAEQDPRVIEVYLDVLLRRPMPGAFPRLVQLLVDPALGEAAARSILRLHDDRRLPDGWQTQVVETARQAVDSRLQPTFIRLYGVACPDEELERVRALLDNEDAALRRAAAEALRRRGERDILLAHLEDEAVFPSAVRLLSDTADLDALRRLATIRCPASLQSEWEQSLQRCAAGLPAGDLIAADDILAQQAPDQVQTRIGLLTRAFDNGTTVPAPLVRSALLRLGTLLVERGDISTMDGILERATVPADPEVDALRFRVLALAQDYDGAARLARPPADWVNLLRWAAPRERINAVPLRDEILKRFAVALETDAELRAAFDEASTAIDLRVGPVPSTGVGGARRSNGTNGAVGGGSAPRRNGDPLNSLVGPA